MIKEKRTLPIGVEYKGKRYRELEIEPRRVGHMIDALDDERAQDNPRYAEICTLACQIVTACCPNRPCNTVHPGSSVRAFIGRTSGA